MVSTNQDPILVCWYVLAFSLCLWRSDKRNSKRTLCVHALLDKDLQGGGALSETKAKPVDLVVESISILGFIELVLEGLFMDLE